MGRGAGDMAAFRGARYQRGHGLRSWLSGLWRSIWPVMKPALGSLGKEVGTRALTAAGRLAGDVAAGDKPFRDSAAERLGQALRGEGYKRKGKRKKRHSSPTKRNAKRHRTDFFNH